MYLTFTFCEKQEDAEGQFSSESQCNSDVSTVFEV